MITRRWCEVPLWLFSIHMISDVVSLDVFPSENTTVPEFKHAGSLFACLGQVKCQQGLREDRGRILLSPASSLVHKRACTQDLSLVFNSMVYVDQSEALQMWLLARVFGAQRSGVTSVASSS